MLEPWVEIHGVSIKRGEAHRGEESNDNGLLEPISSLGFNEYDEPVESPLLVPIEEND